MLSWFTEGGAAAGLPVVRIKNRFALNRADVPDGYRDLKVFVLYAEGGDGGGGGGSGGGEGLGIIGEVQIHDKALHDLGLKVADTRATTTSVITHARQGPPRPRAEGKAHSLLEACFRCCRAMCGVTSGGHRRNAPWPESGLKLSLSHTQNHSLTN